MLQAINTQNANQFAMLAKVPQTILPGPRKNIKLLKIKRTSASPCGLHQGKALKKRGIHHKKQVNEASRYKHK